MKKPVLSIEEAEPKKATRADRPPTEGFVMVVDGHFKSTMRRGCETAGRNWSPSDAIEIYDAATQVRTLLS